MTDHAKAPREPHHRLEVEGRVGAFTLGVSAELRAPWTVLFGPSGCGKSTLLRALCGLTPHLSTTFTRHSSDGASQNLQDLPPERRQLAYAPQHAALFPHLTVQQNITFASTLRWSSSLQRSPAQEAITLFDLTPLLQKRPQDLSGGERGRVNLARAFAVPEPRLLLLDEPFTGIDRAYRNDLIARMRSWIEARGLPVLSVTHDVDEVFLLRAEVIRLREGQVIAQGLARDVLREEADRMRSALTPRHPL